MGSLESPCRTSYWSSIETIALNCLLCEKIAFCVLIWLQTNKQTDRRTNRWTAWMCKRRLNNNYRDLEIWVRDYSRSLKWVPLESLAAVSNSHSVVTMVIYLVSFSKIGIFFIHLEVPSEYCCNVLVWKN